MDEQEQIPAPVEAPIPPGGGSWECLPDGTLKKREGTEPAKTDLKPAP